METKKQIQKIVRLTGNNKVKVLLEDNNQIKIIDDIYEIYLIEK